MKLNFRIIFLIILLMHSLSALANHPVIIDTDVGGDDQIAMLYLLNNKHVSVSAISIVSDGEAHCSAALTNVNKLLELTHQLNIPVACGGFKPLQGNHHFPDSVHKEADDGQVVSDLKSKQTARELLQETLEKSPETVDILAIGPLTNLAELIQANPKIKSKVHRLVIMGGAIGVPGNIIEVDPTSKNAKAEWNIYIDPKAADIVFRSGVPIVLVSLDVTNQMLVSKDFYQKLKTGKTSTSQYAFHLYQRNEIEIAKQHWYFWDSLSAVITSQDAVAKLTPKNIRILLSPESKAGATIVDDQAGSPILVCIKVDKSKAKNLLLHYLINAGRSDGIQNRRFSG